MNAKNEELKKRETAEVSTEMTQDGPVYVPSTDIYETEKDLVVLAEMPGVDEKHVDVSLEDNELSITGTRGDNDVPKGYQLLSHGYSPGSYRRTFKVLADIDVAKIKAKMNNGLLTLTLPKAEKAKPKKIKVSA
jgi:HSP20 family protein